MFCVQLEFMEKGNGDPFVSMGLVDPYDLFLSEWSASIIGPPGVSTLTSESLLLLLV
jgi:hypothetical protein